MPVSISVGLSNSSKANNHVFVVETQRSRTHIEDLHAAKECVYDPLH